MLIEGGLVNLVLVPIYKKMLRHKLTVYRIASTLVVDMFAYFPRLFGGIKRLYVAVAVNHTRYVIV